MSCADGEATRSSAVPDGGVWAINAIAKNAVGKARHRFNRVMVISRFEHYGLPCHSVYHEIATDKGVALTLGSAASRLASSCVPRPESSRIFHKLRAPRFAIPGFSSLRLFCFPSELE